MQQGRNAAESAVIRPKQAAARKLASNGAGFKEIAAARALPAARYGGSRPIENCIPSAI
jgi:hypothetical protein